MGAASGLKQLCLESHTAKFWKGKRGVFGRVNLFIITYNHLKGRHKISRLMPETCCLPRVCFKMQILARNLLNWPKSFQFLPPTVSFKLAILIDFFYVLFYFRYICCLNGIQWSSCGINWFLGVSADNDVTCVLLCASGLLFERKEQLRSRELCWRCVLSFARKITTLNRSSLHFTKPTSQRRRATIDRRVLNFTNHGESRYHANTAAIC